MGFINGDRVPYIVAQKEMEEAKENAMLKRQNRHDWLVAVVGGAIGGLIVLLISVLLKIQ